MPLQSFDRDDLKAEADGLKLYCFQAIFCLFGTKVTAEAFMDVVFQAMTVHGIVLRAQVLENMSEQLAAGTLNENVLNTSLTLLASRLDQVAAKLGGLMELVEETKTPGPRH